MTAVSGRPSHAKVHTSGIIVPDVDIHEALLLGPEDSEGINLGYSGQTYVDWLGSIILRGGTAPSPDAVDEKSLF